MFAKIDEHSDLGTALEEYSRIRNPDAEAMCDLAMYNYVEVTREDTHKKKVCLVVGPLRGGEGGKTSRTTQVWGGGYPDLSGSST